MLGVGGARALAAIGHKPTVWHINEGHAAFLVLERIRSLVAEGLPLDAAIEAVAANTVFTTHTPVPAGHDHFPESTVARLPEELFRRARHRVGLGRPPAGGDFNMTALAHPRLALPERRVAHPRRRLGAPAARLLAAGRARREPARLRHQRRARGDLPRAGMGRGARPLPRRGLDAPPRPSRHLGKDPRHSRPHLLERAPGHQGAPVPHGAPSRRAQHRAQPRQRVAPAAAAATTPTRANPNVLTIGFGRRFATYKRATLLFNDLDNLRRLLATAQRQVLFLFAGKAHPADEPGQELIRTLAHLSRQEISPAASCSSRATTCTSRAAWSPASTYGSTIRCTRSKPPAPPA